jgi:hypothetical protein
MSDKEVMQIIHDALQNKSKWYIDHYIPDDCPELQDIVEKAKEQADATISQLSTYALYQRYKKWLKDDPLILDEDKYFSTFLSDLAFDLGKKALHFEDRLMYEDSCSLRFIWV